MSIPQEKLKMLNDIKANSNLAIFKVLETLKDDAEKIAQKEIAKIKNEMVLEMENRMKQMHEEMMKEMSEDAKVEKVAMKLATKIAIMEKGDKGEKGENYILTENDKVEIAGMKKGEDGKDYVLTDIDKTEIAGKITVPKKIIEKIEVIHEQPIIEQKITNEIKEVAKYETADQIADKINTLEEKIEQKTIKGLLKTIENLKISIQNARMHNAKGGGGGGMGNAQHESFNVTSATTTITLAYNIASNGNAIWANYNGANIVKGTHYTQSGKVLTLLFTPDDTPASAIDIIYIRK